MVIIGILILVVLVLREVKTYVFNNWVLSQQVLERCTKFQREVISDFIFVQNVHDDEQLVKYLVEELEVFALYVLSLSPRDEILAYNVQGRVFCQVVQRLDGMYGLFLPNRGYVCEHSRRLYDLWRVR